MGDNQRRLRLKFDSSGAYGYICHSNKKIRSININFLIVNKLAGTHFFHQVREAVRSAIKQRRDQVIALRNALCPVGKIPVLCGLLWARKEENILAGPVLRSCRLVAID